MSRTWFVLLLVVVGCTSNVDHPFRNLGELYDAIEVARTSADEMERRDTDGDGIPDVIEERLETDPADRDTDRDGLVDNFELFGDGLFDPTDRLPDVDRDDRIAPIDQDDDGDGINDGSLVDSDEDGIPNYLEFYGYTYDWLTGRFASWNGDPEVAHYRTDPLHYSTDQDAFSDAEEVTGIGLDVSVQPPGDHPLVPATPNIVMEVLGYSVTLNEDITYEEGASLARGQTWNRETEQTHSHTSEQNWEVGVEAGYSGGSVHVVAHANYGGSSSSTHSTSTAVATGGSVLSEESWSTARSVNPTDAARLKLYVRVHNRGGAPVSNVIPTITIKIGGLNIATFEPGNAQINMLVPGESYPEDPSVAWVIDSIDTGAGIAPIALTMRELRALESGAPVGVTVTQLLGDVMRLGSDGIWERVGDVNEFVSRCEAVSANLRVDLGDGTFVHHLVYAGEGASAPDMTLPDALSLLGVDDDGVLRFDEPNGARREVSLDGYAFAFDLETLRRNGWTTQGDGALEPPEGWAVDDVDLHPGTNVLVRAPRDESDVLPLIHYAYIDATTREVKVCASDYQGIRSVEIEADEGGTLTLSEDIRGAGFYTGMPDEPTFFAAEGLRVRVENLAGSTAEQPVGSLFVAPGPRAPIIRSVRLDLAGHHVYANVESGASHDPDSTVAWVQAFHPGLPGGAVALEPVVNRFEDPNGYSATLPTTFASTSVEIVAFVTDDVFSRHLVSPGEIISAHVAGTQRLAASIDTTGGDEEWWVPWFDLDTGSAVGHFYEADNWNDAWNPTAPIDLWVRLDEGARGYMFFNGTYEKVASVDFGSTTPGYIDSLNPTQTDPLQLNADAGLRSGDILAIRTTDGRYAKIKVLSLSYYEDVWTNYYRFIMDVEYVTFD